MLVNALWVSLSVYNLLAMLCDNVDESTAPTKACSVSVRWQAGWILIANEMKQEKKKTLFLGYNTSKCNKQFKDQTDAVALSKSPDEKLLPQLALDKASIHKLI